MNDAAIPSVFYAPLMAVQRLIESFSDQGVIIGGIAASLLGEPRTTADIDAYVIAMLSEIDELLLLASQQGISPRIDGAAEFAKKSRVLLLQHDQSGIAIDLSLGMLPFEQEAVERSQLFQAGEIEIRLITPEDLIIQKAVAHRPKDLTDIEGIIIANPELDWARIEFWVQQFAELLEQPELWLDVHKLRNEES